MAIRRLNFTKRKKLTREQVQIRLSPKVDGESRTFDVQLAFPSDLPGEALVFVEAQRSSPFARMRFPWGTVGAPTPPPLNGRRLVEFSEDLPLPTFRVKVTSATGESGKLLAEAHRLKPVDPSETPDRRRGILPIVWQNNDGLVWRLDIDESSGPLLYLDTTADPYRDLPRDSRFQALVYPEIIRRILEFILEDEDGLDEPDSWQQAWLSLPRVSFGFTEPLPVGGDRAGKMEWIEMAVRWCSRKAGFCQAMAPQAGDE